MPSPSSSASTASAITASSPEFELRPWSSRVTVTSPESFAAGYEWHAIGYEGAQDAFEHFRSVPPGLPSPADSFSPKGR